MKLTRQDLLQTQSYINGEWVNADSGATSPVNNPATGKIVAEVADLGSPETQRAIAAAKDAFPIWSSKTVKERHAILHRWYELLMEHQNDLAQILTAEQGKPLSEAAGEIAYGANYIQWFAEEAKRIYGDIIAPPADNKRLVVIKQPVGVVASITPWNFPNAMIARKAAPALAAGCTFVAKPAMETPLSALALAKLGEEAGIPSGVFNVVCGNDAPAIGKAMTDSIDVAKLTFTGSTAVGKTLLAQCANTVKRTSMELGGNAPFIVFDDADLDKALDGLIASKFRNAGQTCVCSNRIFVQAGVYDAFAEKLVDAVNAFKVGDGTESGVDIGPLIRDSAAENVASLVDDAVSKGANIACGGNNAGGRFYEPTVLTDANDSMRVFDEEIFGPIAPLIKFDTDEDAVNMANNTRFGLAAYFYTSDISRSWRVSEALEYGMVGINEGMISNEMAPFGGVKESGIGREGSHYGIDDYINIKYLVIGI